MSNENLKFYVTATEVEGAIFAHTNDGIYDSVSLRLAKTGSGSEAEAKRIVSLISQGRSPFIIRRSRMPTPDVVEVISVPEENPQERLVQTIDNIPILNRVYGEDMADRIMLSHMAKTIIRNS